ncbi:hypothetical protein [Pimelobacter simplex]|uniref:hypothetical protein n=1 Tax=Nocardioides simplex TaxID=2045 RepID=UPI00214FDA8F|nr:hypothetical protein [Pimelobacter simplex]UUW92258.1 hypothetical protein M0M43_12480 [Pimelobacter simplex]UUW96085.1 hypothetical protein M0M48_01110 [Pimelobacter simplex]
MPRKSTPTISEALDEYLLIRSINRAKSTITNDRALLRKFVRELGAETRVHVLRAQDVEVWFAGVARAQKASSYNKVRERVQGFMRFCMDRKWIDCDPTSQVGRRTVHEEDRLRLTAPQMVQLIELTENPRDRAMLATACNTGLRASDLSASGVQQSGVRRT